MPAKPDSRFAQLPVLDTLAPDGTPRRVIALRITPGKVTPLPTPHLVKQAEELDLLARRFLGDEKLWWRILDANDMVYPLDIRAGYVLALPSPAAATRAVRAKLTMPVRTPFYQVMLEGVDITPWVNSVAVTEDDKQADNVAITIPDPRMIYSDGIFEGTTVEVDMGYAEPSQHALLLRAIITKVEQTYPDNGVPTVTLKGEDKSIMMGLRERKKVWKGRKLSDVIREIAKPYGFDRVEAKPDPDPNIQSHPITQDGKTDLAFLQELAGQYHCKCFVELDEHAKEVLYFLPERGIVTARRPDRLILRYRLGPDSNLITFSPAFDSSYIDRKKQIADLDKKGNKVKTTEKPTETLVWVLDPARMAQASALDRDRIQKLYSVGAAKKQQLQTELTAAKVVSGQVAADQSELESQTGSLQSQKLGMSATGTTFGNIWLRAKSNITIEGPNQRFSGEWYVSSVTNKIDGGAYKTDFKCVR